MANLEAGTDRFLRERLDGWSGVLPFAVAVVAQVANPPGHRGARDERAVAERVLRLLEGAGAGAPDGAEFLVADPVLLAAFFQNADLLYAHGALRADEVSGLIMRALERVHDRLPAVRDTADEEADHAGS